MSFKDRVKKYGIINEMAVAKSKRENVLKQMRKAIDSDDYKKAAEIFKRNGGSNIIKDFKKEGNPEFGLDSSEVTKLKNALKSVDSDKVETKAEVTATSDDPLDSDFLKSLKTSINTIRDRYKAQLSILKGNPIDMASAAPINRKDSREGVENSIKYREDKIKELKNDLESLSSKVDGFNEIKDDEFQKMSIEEKKRYMDKKKEARQLQERMRKTLEKYDTGVKERKKQRGRPDSAIERAGEHGRAGVQLLKSFDELIDKYNKAKPITKEDIQKLKKVLTEWLPLLKDRTDTFHDPKQLGVVNRSLSKITNILSDDSSFSDGILDVDSSEDLFDELTKINTDR